MKPMSSRSRASRFALWAAVFALLLKAAVPAFAAMAAQRQGVPVAEVCPVYGVSLVPAHAAQAEHAHHHHHGHEHGGKTEDHKAHELAAHGDHCALTALATLAGPDPVDWGVAPPGHSTIAALPPRSEPAPDACALWVARMKHGPPAFA
jgi:hypothetical protein